MESSSLATYAEPGYLLYHRAGELMAQRFNATKLAVEGDPVPLASGLWLWATGGLTAISTSSSGLLMFATRPSRPARLTWFDRNGRPTGTLAETAEWVHVALSPDDRMVAAEQMDPRLGTGTIWTIDVAHNLPARLTPDPVWSFAPVWAPDGARLVYSASKGGAANLFVRPADGVGAEQPFFASPALKVPTDWSRDGRIVFDVTSSSGSDIVSLPATGERAEPSAIVSSPASERSGKVSPNGRWIAYSSNESGQAEIYVRAINGPGRWPISRNGGWHPRWRRDGQELFFVGADSTLRVVKVSDGPVFSAGEPQILPIRVAPDVTASRYPYDTTANGQRFLVLVRTADQPEPAIMAIAHWTDLLRK
jgi:WD40 repeat protein